MNPNEEHKLFSNTSYRPPQLNFTVMGRRSGNRDTRSGGKQSEEPATDSATAHSSVPFNQVFSEAQSSYGEPTYSAGQFIGFYYRRRIEFQLDPSNHQASFVQKKPSMTENDYVSSGGRTNVSTGSTSTHASSYPSLNESIFSAHGVDKASSLPSSVSTQELLMQQEQDAMEVLEEDVMPSTVGLDVELNSIGDWMYASDAEVDDNFVFARA